eukprot:32725-Chlamydomonas_euryale.AAC.9
MPTASWGRMQGHQTQLGRYTSHRLQWCDLTAAAAIAMPVTEPGAQKSFLLWRPTHGNTMPEHQTQLRPDKKLELCRCCAGH